MVLRFLALLGFLLAFALPAAAQDVRTADTSSFDQTAIRDVINRQLEAFRRDDGDTAFGLASPNIRGMFGNAEIFMDMVRQGYAPVYRPRSVEFGELGELAGQPAQKVYVIGPDGRPVTAVYVMTQLADGTWRVDGCYLQAPERNQV